MSKMMLTGINLNGQKATNAADATSANDLVTFQQLQALISGLQWKQFGVVAASTGNGTLATAYANGQSLDGYTLVTGDRILLKDQTSAAENGIYTVNASGAPSRATDADSTAELENAAVFVQKGTTNADKAFVQTATVTTVGTTAQVWAPFGGGSTYTAGATGGLQLTGTQFDVKLDTNPGLVTGSGGIKVDSSVVVLKYAADCAATTNPQTFTHNLGTKDVVVMVRRKSDDVFVEADITATSTSAISVDFGGAPSSAQYRVIVHA